MLPVTSMIYSLIFYKPIVEVFDDDNDGTSKYDNYYYYNYFKNNHHGSNACVMTKCFLNYLVTKRG